MNILAFVIGVGIVSGLLIYFSTTLEKKHQIFKLFCAFIFVTMLLFVPKALVDNNDNCEILLNSTYESYVYGDNFTGYHWDYDFAPVPQNPIDAAYLFHRNTTYSYDRICFEDMTSTAGAFFKIITGCLIVFWLYITCYLIYVVVMSAFEQGKKMKDWDRKLK